MKTKVAFVLFLMLAQAAAYSQQVRRLSLEILNLPIGKGYNGTVTLTTDDGICQSTTCKEGSMDLYFFDYLANDASLTIRNDQGKTTNVSLDCLLHTKSILQTPYATIKVVENKIVAIDDMNFLIRLLPNRQIEPKIKPDFSSVWQRQTTDTVIWYFPTETLLDIDYYDNLVEDTAYLKGYYNEHGCYPDKRVKKRLAKDMAAQAAEFAGGWYSWNLLRLNEPVLCNGSVNDIYRFTWIANTFFHEYDPYSIRIERQDEGSAIVYCNYETRSGREISSLCCNIFSIDANTFNQFLELVNTIRFGDGKSLTHQKGWQNSSVTMILEISNNSKYHVIFRGEGEDEGLEELQRFLWVLTGLGENKIVHKR